jgi:hypothetical protein
LRKLSFPILILLVFGCQKSDIADLRGKEPILFGLFIAGQTAHHLNYFEAQETNSALPIQKLAEITITDEQGQITSLNYSSNGYYSDESFILQPNQSYFIKSIDNNDNVSEGLVEIPPAIALTGLDQDTIDISELGSLAIGMGWTALDEGKFSFVLQLENLETEKVPLPGVSGLFAERNRFPQLEASLFLQKDDFSYFGLHRLTVYAIDRELDAVFFFEPSDIRGILKNAPDNIVGGRGFVAGVSSFSIDLFVQE